MLKIKWRFIEKKGSNEKPTMFFSRTAPVIIFPAGVYTASIKHVKTRLVNVGPHAKSMTGVVSVEWETNEDVQESV